MSAAVGAGCLAVAAVGGAIFAPRASGQDPDDTAIGRGRTLYLQSCVSCHGPMGEGSDDGPALTNVGAASADFVLRTGRMPLSSPDQESNRKPPAYDDADIEALVSYVASLGDGPPIPTVEPEAGNLEVGGELFLANCAACHNATGMGGALSYGQHAPSLFDATPVDIAEAMRTGPSQMPVFSEAQLDDQEVNSIVRYVRYLRDPEDRGGLSLGRAGPIPEGFVALLAGLGPLILAVRWITRDPGGEVAEKG
jgi:ubiquinol-cytochrome c reductase cytochrome c subunit